MANETNQPNNDSINQKSVVLAGGCFWCMEKPYDQLKGVISTTSGYSGGSKETATYPQVSSGRTQHIEVIEVVYDAKQVDFETLIKMFWFNVDPFDAKGQFCDKGYQYQSAIFFEDEKEQEIAERTKKEIETEFGQKVATQILPRQPFYAAEDYHQNYYLTNPVRYTYYRFNCGRDQRLKQIWASHAGGKHLIEAKQ